MQETFITSMHLLCIVSCGGVCH